MFSVSPSLHPSPSTVGHDSRTCGYSLAFRRPFQTSLGRVVLSNPAPILNWPLLIGFAGVGGAIQRQLTHSPPPTHGAIPVQQVLIISFQLVQSRLNRVSFENQLHGRSFPCPLHTPTHRTITSPRQRHRHTVQPTRRSSKWSCKAPSVVQLT